MAMTAEQARAIAQAGAAASPPLPRGPDPWSGHGVTHTEVAPSAGPPPGGSGEVDERARTLAMPRYDRTMMANPNQEPTQGPMGWRGTPSPPSPGADAAALTSTQRAPVSSMNGPYAAEGPRAADLRRPEMRSPAPRPEGTSRSIWIPVLIVLIVGLAGTAAFLWWRTTQAAEPTTSIELAPPS